MGSDAAKATRTISGAKANLNRGSGTGPDTNRGTGARTTSSAKPNVSKGGATGTGGGTGGTRTTGGTKSNSGKDAAAAGGGRDATSDRRSPDGMAGAGGATVRHAGTGLTSNRAASRKWVNRAEGDRRSKARLRLVDSEGVIVLNDRRIPGSKISIKSIAISSGGVFVIDTKAYKGLVHIKRSGTIKDLGPAELHIGRRNCTSSVEDLNRQAETVREALRTTPWGAEVPVTALLCLTRAAWGFASPIEINDVWVGWPRLLNGRVNEPGLMDSPTVVEVSELIAERLP